MRDDHARRLAATYPWTLTLETRFTDMDVNRHLNNVAVQRLYEEARVRFNQAVRAAHPELGRVRYLVARVATDYLDEGQYPAPVEIGYGVGTVGRTSYVAALGMFQAGRCIGLCDTVMVHRGESAPAPLPEALRAVLGEWALKG